MSSDFATPGSYRLVIGSVVVAAGAITLCALVAIAYMFGWIPARGAISTPAGFASPGQQVAGTAPGVALLPNESVVAPEPSPAPQPAPPKAGPTVPDYSRAKPPRDIAPAASPQASAPAAAPKPIPPAAPPKAIELAAAPTAPPPARDNYCVNCGTVTAITAYRDVWEVRVRFQDGGLETFRYRSPPPFGMGQRVRLEGERLVRDR